MFVDSQLEHLVHGVQLILFGQDFFSQLTREWQRFDGDGTRKKIMTLTITITLQLQLHYNYIQNKALY